jgi:hypothetical protein
MKLTIQTHSQSGSFAAPHGRQSLRHVWSKRDAADVLLDWADDHSRYGSDERDATALVWRGHLSDVTDQYPDFALTLGPRLGVHWDPC